MKKMMLLVAALLILSAGNAFAMVIPTIDGSIGAGEWASEVILNATDLNESGITDSYDIKGLRMKLASGTGSTDGMYMLWENYAAPTFATQDPFGINPVIYRVGLDMDQNGSFLDLVDRRVEYRATGLNVYNGTGGLVSGAPVSVMGSVVEFYIPGGMFANFPDAGFNGFLLLDNGGKDADDQLPDEGTFKTPEPGSAMLLGMGLLGFAGMIRRKFTA